MFYLAGIAIALFLAFILLTKNNKTTADKVLFFWLLIIGFHLFLYYLFIENQYSKFPYLLGFHISLPLIHGPFLYLYTASVTNKKISWTINSLHFLPYSISFISIIDFIILPFEEQALLYSNKSKGYETFLWFNMIAIIISVITYVVTSLLLLKKHKNSLLNQFSSTERISLSWLKVLIYGVGVAWVFIIYQNNELLYSYIVLWVILLGYFNINQVNVLSKNSNLINDNKTILSNSTLTTEDDSSEQVLHSTKKYLKSGLSEEDAKKIHLLLIQKMNNEELFTNPGISLVELSQHLDIHQNNLSQVINSFEGKNFYDYINSLRLKKFLELIEQGGNQKYTLLSIAYDCGFNSKSSFNKYFKKIMLQTPSEYVNNLKTKINFKN